MEEAQFLCDEIAIMDAGKIIAQGSPDSLLKQHYKNVIIELPLQDDQDLLDGVEHRVLQTQGIIEIETDDVNASLGVLTARLDNLNGMNIRQPNLEDLFLDLTGHSLRT
jgi:ABC-2 type transport system ATP-binding protein